MISTIRVSPPSCGTMVPTFTPSRRIVARSHVSITSRRRCVMKRTLRPRSRQSRMTAKTRSARSDGSAAVISSRMRSCGSCASARARSSIRSIGSGRSSTSSRRSSRIPIPSRLVRTASMDVPVRRRFWATERSGTSAGSWNTGESPKRVALRGEPGRTVLPETLIVPASGRMTPDSALTRVLLPAPLAPSRAWTSPGAMERSAERRATTGPYCFAIARASRSGVWSLMGQGRLAVKPPAPRPRSGRALGPLLFRRSPESPFGDSGLTQGGGGCPPPPRDERRGYGPLHSAYCLSV